MFQCVCSMLVVHVHVHVHTSTARKNSHVPFCKTADWACEHVRAGILCFDSFASRFVRCVCCYWAIVNAQPYILFAVRWMWVSAWVTVDFFSLRFFYCCCCSVSSTMQPMCICTYDWLGSRVYAYAEQYIMLTDTIFYVGWQLNGIVFFFVIVSMQYEGTILQWRVNAFMGDVSFLCIYSESERKKTHSIPRHIKNAVCLHRMKSDNMICWI